MIAARSDAPRYAGAALITDGTDETLMRSAEFEIRPTSKQSGALAFLLRVLCEIYNAALEERRSAWQREERWGRGRDPETGKPVPRVDVFSQFTQVAAITAQRPTLARFGIQPLRGVLRRLDTAYSGFMTRAQAGEKAGPPRFQSYRRFHTATWAEPASWKLHLESSTLYVQGVGHIRLPKSSLDQLRRLLERGGEPRTLTIKCRHTLKGVQWRAIVGFRAVAARPVPALQGPDSVGGFDRGVAVTLAGSGGELLTMPEFAQAAQPELVRLQRALARAPQGSRKRENLRLRIRRLRERVADRTENWARHAARDIVADYDVVALEELRLQNMMRSASGTVENPGTNVAQKRGLNRSLQESALGLVGRWVHVRAEDAGRRTWLVPAAYSSQECAVCAHTEEGNRPTRDEFLCLACGHAAHADVNAGRVVARRARVAEEAWAAAGSPLLVRPTPRMRRRKPAGEGTSPPL